MNTKQLIEKIKSTPEAVEFNDVMDTITADYNYQACTFYNGQGDNRLTNKAGTNEGSCKIFAFAQLNQLNQPETLACFGIYYREDVLQNPTGDDHGNIRHFILSGWNGIQFEGTALHKK